MPPSVEPILRDLDDRFGRARIGQRVAHRRAPAIPRDPLALFHHRQHLHVERLARLEREPRAHRRVRDSAFADELRCAARIAHIDADGPRGERIAEPAVARRAEGEHGIDALGFALRREPRVAIEIRLGGGRPGDVEKADLLGLCGRNRGALGERVEVEIAELFAVGGLGARLVAARRGRARGIARAIVVLGAADRSGDEQRLGGGEGRAAGVVQRDPALDVELARLFIEQGDIIGLPAEPARQITERRRARPRRIAVERDRQGRARAQIGRQRREDHATGAAVEHFDPAADLDDRAAIVGEHAGLLARLGAGRGVGADERDGLADRLVHQLLRREQVVIEILLDDTRARCLERDGLGADRGGDVGEVLATAAARERELARVLDQGEIVIVDRDRDVALPRARTFVLR